MSSSTSSTSPKPNQTPRPTPAPRSRSVSPNPNAFSWSLTETPRPRARSTLASRPEPGPGTRLSRSRRRDREHSQIDVDVPSPTTSTEAGSARVVPVRQKLSCRRRLNLLSISDSTIEPCPSTPPTAPDQQCSSAFVEHSYSRSPVHSNNPFRTPRSPVLPSNPFRTPRSPPPVPNTPTPTQTTRKKIVPLFYRSPSRGSSIDGLDPKTVLKAQLEEIFAVAVTVYDKFPGRHMKNLYEDLLFLPKYTFLQTHMDVSTIARKIQEGKYTSIDELKADFGTLGTNVRAANLPGSQIAEYAGRIERMVSGKVDEIKEGNVSTYLYTKGSGEITPSTIVALAIRPETDGSQSQEDSTRTQKGAADANNEIFEEIEISDDDELAPTELINLVSPDQPTQYIELGPQVQDLPTPETPITAPRRNSRRIIESSSDESDEPELVGFLEPQPGCSKWINKRPAFSGSQRKTTHSEVDMDPPSPASTKVISPSPGSVLNLMYSDSDGPEIYTTASEREMEAEDEAESEPDEVEIVDVVINSKNYKEKEQSDDIDPDYVASASSSESEEDEETEISDEEDVDYTNYLCGEVTPPSYSGSESSGPVEGIDKKNCNFGSMFSLYEAIYNFVDESGKSYTKYFLKLPNKQTNPGYYNKIQNPITLGRIKMKIQEEKYTYVAELKDDFKTMLRNARIIHGPSHQIYKASTKLEKLVDSCKLALKEHVVDKHKFYISTIEFVNSDSEGDAGAVMKLNFNDLVI